MTKKKSNRQKALDTLAKHHCLTAYEQIIEDGIALRADIKKMWVKALRSRKFKQGDGLLKCENSVTGKTEYCCLGVLAEISGDFVESHGADLGTHNGYYLKDRTIYEGEREIDVYDGSNLTLPPLYMENVVQDLLAALNDGGESFRTIANVIQELL